MTVTAKANSGYPMHWDKEKNVWEPDGCEPCPKCGKMPTKEGYDACIGYVPGATSVCCGHGLVSPYITFDGEWALAVIKWAKERGDQNEPQL